MKFLVATITLYLALAATPSQIASAEESAVPAATAQISADHISLNPDDQTVRATGNVQLDIDDLSLRASLLRLNMTRDAVEAESPFALRWNDMILSGDYLHFSPGTRRLTVTGLNTAIPRPPVMLHLEAREMICVENRCIAQFAEASLCPDPGEGFRVQADQVRLFANGAISLKHPVLTLKQNPIFALPWIHITTPDQPGFLMPVLGWSPSAGLIIGPSGLIPFGAAQFSGHVAARTASGMEDSLTLSLPNQKIAFHHLLDHGDNDARLDASLWAPLMNARAAAELDLVSSRKILDETTFYNEDRAASHTRSQVAVSTNRRFFHLDSSLVHLQALDDPLHRSANTADISWRLHYAEGSRPIVPSVYASFHRVFDEGDTIVDIETHDTVSPFSRLLIAPAIAFPFSAGPFATITTLSSLHRLWLFDDAPDNTGQHLIAAGTRIALPLVARLRHTRHRMTPALSFHTSPWESSSAPDVNTDDWDSISIGSELEARLDNAWQSISSNNLFSLNLALRSDLHRTDQSTTLTFARIDTDFSSAFLDCDGALSLNAATGIPDHGRVLLQFKDRFGDSLSSGVSYYGTETGFYADRFNGEGLPLIYAPLIPFDEQQLSLREGLRISITDSIFARMDAAVALLPEARLTALVYGLEYHSLCDRISVTLEASHQFAEAAPTIRALLKWIPR